MRNSISILVFVFGVISMTAQIKNVKVEFELPASLKESSGVIFFNDKLITHNDSGGENKLYELDITSGEVTRTVTITNAINVDWEDITQDATSIYIGDIGNNSGSRTDLKIYKISKSDYISNDAVTAEIIAFSYLAQTDFTANLFKTEWDSEALISFDSSNLILFSKNWVEDKTKAYTISKNAGNYSLSPMATTLNSGGLITGGTFNPLSKKLYLVGYSSLLQPFVWVNENFSSNTDIFDGTNTKTVLELFQREQIEAITFLDEKRYYMTSESFSYGPISVNAKLISFSTADSLSTEMFIETEAVLVYPNPVVSFLNLKSQNIDFIELFDLNSRLLYKGSTHRIDMRTFENGLYIVRITLKDQQTQLKKIIKK